jgi:hypothetical protein
MKFSTWLNALVAKDTPAGDADYVVIYDASSGDSKKALLDNLPAGAGGGIDDSGWVSAGETWTYASADAPTFTFTISGDKTGKYSAGMRIKLTQTSVKYFIITAVAYVDPNTTVTVYGGTDYTLANAAITEPYYSVVKAPLSFPLDPTKWTVRVTNTAEQSQSSPTNGVWYNLGSITISIPIGAWHVSYQANGNVTKTSTAFINCIITLSTANNSESDKDFSSMLVLGGSSGTLTLRAEVSRSKQLTLASKTSYFLNASTGTGVGSIGVMGDASTTIIEAVCAYL